MELRHLQTSPDCSGNPLRSKDCNGKRDYQKLQGESISLKIKQGWVKLQDQKLRL